MLSFLVALWALWVCVLVKRFLSHDHQATDSQQSTAVDDGMVLIRDQSCDNLSRAFPCDGCQLPGNQIRDNQIPALPADHDTLLNW